MLDKCRHFSYNYSNLLVLNHYKLSAMYKKAGPVFAFSFLFTVAYLLISGSSLQIGQNINLQRSAASVASQNKTTIGCAMAHCDVRMSDWAVYPLPGPNTQILWHDTINNSDIGVGRGLGCSTNGNRVACSFGNLPAGYPDLPCEPISNNLVVYEYAGFNGLPYKRWSSGNIFDCTLFASAPIIMASGSVIAADTSHMVRFRASGSTLWDVPKSPGLPTSPLLTPNGTVILANYMGPIEAFDVVTGESLGLLDLIEEGGRYHTLNTPALRGNRMYILTGQSLYPTKGRLYAIDLNYGSPPNQFFQVAWYVNYGGISGASPLLARSDMILFDGDRLYAGGPLDPHVYAVQDNGDSGTIVWTKAMPGIMRVSFAQDRRGGFWVATSASATDPQSRQWITRLAVTDLNGDYEGDILEQINIDALIPEEGDFMVSSVMTMAGSSLNPGMILSATQFDDDVNVVSTYVLGLDLYTRQPVWIVNLPGDFTPGQFPIANGFYGPRVFFGAKTGGLWVLGELVNNN